MHISRQRRFCSYASHFIKHNVLRRLFCMRVVNELTENAGNEIARNENDGPITRNIVTGHMKTMKDRAIVARVE